MCTDKVRDRIRFQSKDTGDICKSGQSLHIRVKSTVFTHDFFAGLLDLVCQQARSDGDKVYEKKKIESSKSEVHLKVNSKKDFKCYLIKLVCPSFFPFCSKIYKDTATMDE